MLFLPQVGAMCHKDQKALIKLLESARKNAYEAGINVPWWPNEMMKAGSFQIEGEALTKET